MLQISLSGDLASAANALLAHESGEPFIMWFGDTTIEDDDLYRFLYDVERLSIAPLIRLKDGRDPWSVFVDKKYIGNSRTAHCSAVLKTDLIQRNLDLLASPNDPIVIGFSFDEDERQERAIRRWAPRPVRSLIAEKRLSGAAIEELVCGKYGIRKPRLYDMGFAHNNCGGMCVRGGQGQFATLLDKRPALYAKHEQRNEWARKMIGPTAGGFIRVRREGVTEYLHMKEFRERVESGELIPARYEMGGCGCFTDDA